MLTSKANCIGNGKYWLLNPGATYNSQREGCSSKWLIWIVYREPLLILYSVFKDFVSIVYDYTAQINAVANKAAGKGYESTDNYSNLVYEFYNIHNIHIMRESLQKLVEGMF